MLLIGSGVAAAYQPDLMVKLASEDDASYVGSGIYESTASVQSKSQPAFQGSAALYRVLLRNAGDLPDRFVLKGTPSGTGFTVRYLDQAGTDRTAGLSGTGFSTATLAPGESLWISVQVTLPSITPGASYRVSVSATSAGDTARTDEVKTETVACSSSAAVTVSSPPDGTGPVGTVVSYPYTVTNAGSSVNTFALAATTGNGWQHAVAGEDGAATASTGALEPGRAYRFYLRVTIPPSSVSGARAETYLTVTGEGASGGDRVTTTAVTATISVAENVRNLTQGGPFETIATAFPGDILQYRMSITNSGSGPATAVSIDTALPANATLVPGSLWVGTSSSGDGTPCAASECGSARESGGAITARLGQGATESAGGTLAPGKTLYVYFRVQVE